MTVIIQYIRDRHKRLFKLVHAITKNDLPKVQRAPRLQRCLLKNQAEESGKRLEYRWTDATDPPRQPSKKLASQIPKCHISLKNQQFYVIKKDTCYYYFLLLRLHLNKSLIPAYFLSGNPTGSYSVVAGRTCYIRYGNVYEIRI